MIRLDWKKITEESYTAGYRKLLRRKYRLPSGKVDDFDIYNDGDSVAAIVFTSENKVVALRHFRPGPEKIFVELIGGFVEPNESPLHAVQREVLEEVGFKGEPIFIGTSYFSAYNTGKKHIFIVFNSQKVQDPHPETTEFFHVEQTSWPWLLENALQGNTTDLDAILLADRFLTTKGDDLQLIE